MINAGEPVLVCPYNKAHSIIKSRMQFHLVKCRQQYATSEMVSCPYDSTHIIPKLELEFHQQVCGKRIVIDSFIYNVGKSKCPVVPVPADVPPEQLAPCSENWDEGTRFSVLDALKDNAKEKKVLRTLIGASKSERLAHRNEERRRFQRVADIKKEEKKLSEDEDLPLAEKPDAPKFQEPDTHDDLAQAQASELPKEKEVSVYNEENCTDISKTNDTFEVVKSHKKNQGKKNKKNQPQLSQQQQQHIRRPPQSLSRENIEDELNKMTNLSLDRNSNKQLDISGQLLISSVSNDRRLAEVKLVRNAWERPLNMAGMSGHGITPARSLFDDFPSLPVSGRGRGLAFKK